MGVSSSLATLQAVTRKRQTKPTVAAAGKSSDSKAADSKAAAPISAAASAAADVKDSAAAGVAAKAAEILSAGGGVGVGVGVGGSSPVCSVSVNGRLWVYSECGPVTLMAEGPEWSSAAYLTALVRAVDELLTYLIGPFIAEPNHVAAIRSVLVRPHSPQLDTPSRPAPPP
jgi:hypothetical protein